MTFLFDPVPQPSLPILGSDTLFPVHRIFCVGRNYAAHAAEMGHEVDREAPFYFLKSAQHLALAEGDVPIAPRSSDYQHEIELVVGLKSGGTNIPETEALSHVFGYGAGLDMTRRDLQAASKAKGRPWDTAKDVEKSGISTPLKPLDSSMHHNQGLIELRVNGKVTQSADMSEHVWSLPEVIADLSTLYTLKAGDIIMMGTPAGVGPIKSGDVLEGQIANVGSFKISMI